MVGALEMLGQLHQEMQEFVFNGTSILLPELIRLFECSSPDILHVHEELEALSIDINTSKVVIMISTYLIIYFNGGWLHFRWR